MTAEQRGQAAGVLWDQAGPKYTFLVGAGFAALALLVLVTLRCLRSPIVTPSPRDG